MNVHLAHVRSYMINAPQGLRTSPEIRNVATSRQLFALTNDRRGSATFALFPSPAPPQLLPHSDAAAPDSSCKDLSPLCCGFFAFERVSLEMLFTLRVKGSGGCDLGAVISPTSGTHPLLQKWVPEVTWDHSPPRQNISLPVQKAFAHWLRHSQSPDSLEMLFTPRLKLLGAVISCDFRFQDDDAQKLSVSVQNVFKLTEVFGSAKSLLKASAQLANTSGAKIGSFWAPSSRKMKSNKASRHLTNILHGDWKLLDTVILQPEVTWDDGAKKLSVLAPKVFASWADALRQRFHWSKAYQLANILRGGWKLLGTMILCSREAAEKTAC